jgi:hypothetical protein
MIENWLIEELEVLASQELKPNEIAAKFLAAHPNLTVEEAVDVAAVIAHGRHWERKFSMVK